jgi:hypothetical protein
VLGEADRESRGSKSSKHIFSPNLTVEDFIRTLLRAISLLDRNSKIRSSAEQDQMEIYNKRTDQRQWRKHRARRTPYSPKASTLKEVHPKSSIPIWPSTHNTTAIQPLPGLGLRNEIDLSIVESLGPSFS